ncbi:MAG: VacJ family lipoprotein [Nitrospiraceae bacterium]|nr:VacJ family lipoprotein [Nitrospiraceae bacterium]
MRQPIIIFVIAVFLFSLPRVSPAVEDDPGQAAMRADAGQSGSEVPAEPEEAEVKPIPDPLEPWNRVMFTFNDRLYFWVMKPVANGYNFFVPEWGRIRVRNAVSNIAMPVRFANSILQLKFHAAIAELGRFVVNSTGGIGGMFEIVKPNPEIGTGDKDLGQTLGKYGIPSGFYIIWPVLGPSSFRDSVGLAGDYFVTPESYITPFIWDGLAVRSYERVNDTSLRIGDYEDFKEASVEPYAAMRDAYHEYRKSKVEGGAYEGPLYQEKDRR